MPKIKNIIAREILDSLGNPTVEAKVFLDNGIVAKASSPSAVSAASRSGVSENGAVELRDKDNERFRGMGVLKAVENVNNVIGSRLIGQDPADQEIIDSLINELDGTENKKKLGANAILSVSLASARAGAMSGGKELFFHLAETYGFRTPEKNKLPVPCFNLLNGGKYADTNLDFEEYLIIPLRGKEKNCRNFSESLRMGAEIYHELGRVLAEAGFDTDVGAEGGYAPDMHSSIEAIELIMAAAVRAGYKPGVSLGLGINAGSGELYNRETGQYIFKLDQSHFRSSTLTGLYYEWFRKFPIVYLEDGLAPADLDGWKELTRELGSEITLSGDGIFSTNINLLRQGLKEKIANAICINPLSAGTLTQAVECAKLAKKHGYKIVVSQSGGETNDDFIADLAAGIGADYLKAGSLSRGERVAKYNRLAEIENSIA